MPWGYHFDASAKNDWDSIYHGTAMLMKAAGLQRGLAKNAAVTIVRIPEPRYTPEAQDRIDAGNFEDEFYSPAAVIDSYDKIMKDITDRGIGTRAVICVAQGSFDDMPEGIIYEKLLLEKMNQLTNLGAVVVSSSGNNGEAEAEMWDVPAVYNGDLPIIVAGGVDENGDILSFSQYRAHHPIIQKAR